MPMKTPRILVIDDDPAILAVVQVSLETLGEWDVLAADNGQEGLEKAQREKPDIILLDVIMPELDSLTILQRLRSCPTTQKAIIILLTGNGKNWQDFKFYEKNVEGILTKPFNPLELPQKIIDIVQRADEKQKRN